MSDVRKLVLGLGAVVLLIVAIVLVTSATYTVDETEQAVVLQFGAPIGFVGDQDFQESAATDRNVALPAVIGIPHLGHGDDVGGGGQFAQLRGRRGVNRPRQGRQQENECSDAPDRGHDRIIGVVTRPAGRSAQAPESNPHFDRVAGGEVLER